MEVFVLNVNYVFVSERDSAEIKRQSDVRSYAGKLLELSGYRSVVVYLDNFDRVCVLGSDSRFSNPFES